jgi:ABC-2 type transport system ATP-binding protein
VAENPHIPPYLSGWQYLRRCAELLDMSAQDAKDQCGRIIELIGMQGREHTKANTYSKGMIQRFVFGAALIGDPKLLILDEPTAGLDPIGIREMRLLLETLKAQGMTIFLNSHLLSEVEKICDTAAIINQGRLLVKDTISTIVADGDTLEDVFVRLVQG